MNDDFESMIKARLNEQVDAELGRRQAAPPFDADRGVDGYRKVTRHRPWFLPLLAAACVIAVAGGTAGAVHLLGDKKAPVGSTSQLPEPSVGATVAPQPSRTTTGSTASDLPLPVPTAPSTSHPAGEPVRVVLQLGGASISVPVGWLARPLTDYYEGGGSTIYGQGWCLTPARRPVVKGTAAHTDNCPVEFGTIDPNGNALDVDIVGGYAADPHPCGEAAPATIREQSGDRSLGGRAADWRRFRFACSTGVKQYEHYVVASGPGFVLYSHLADDSIDSTMAGIAANSSLPARTSTLRYMDRGYLRTIARTKRTVRITIDRVVLNDDGTVVNNNPATYAYTIPASLWSEGGSGPAVGDLVYLQTDGTRILLFARQP